MKFFFLSLAIYFVLVVARGQTEYLVTLDPSNCDFTIVDSIPNVKWVRVPTSTFDNVNKHYIFQGADANHNWELYTLDANTGNVIYNPPFYFISDPSDNVLNWKYSNSMNKLIGLHWDNSQSTEYFISINTTTGGYTLINSLPGIALIAGFSTYDDINNRYIFIGKDNTGNWYLYSINAANGNIISNPPYPNVGIGDLLYGNSTNTLYGLRWDNLSSTEYLSSIDPTTGTVTDINSIPGVLWILDGFMVFDNFNKRYIFRGGDNNGIWHLYSINAITGDIVYDPVFPTFSGTNDILMPEVDSLTGTIYALYWEDFTSGIRENEINNHICSFFPNPLMYNSELILDKPYKEIIVFVYNTSGQVVKKLTASNSSEINISRDNLSEGQYFISVICDHIYSGSIRTTIQ